ncbi:MAG: prolyl oligopeptidase family serine peptidase [Pseudomonadota bacterium]
MSNADALASPAGCADNAQSSLLLDREEYTFPFESYDEWLRFMDEAPDPAWQAAAMRNVVSRNEFERYTAGETVSAERFVYLSDGLRIRGLKFEPRDPQGCRPVIVYAHGGVGRWSRLTTVDVLEIYRLVEQGYIVVVSMRRGEGGSEGQANTGPGDLADMLTLLDVIDTLPNADSRRIAYLGFSRGAALGFRVLANTDRFRAAVMLGAPTDSLTSKRRAEFDEFVYPDTIIDYEKDKDAALRSLSALYWPERIDPSVALLLLHGTEDERVEASDSLELAAKLSDLGRKVALKLYEDGSHSLIENRSDVRAETDAWLVRHLRPMSNGNAAAGE